MITRSSPNTPGVPETLRNSVSEGMLKNACHTAFCDCFISGKSWRLQRTVTAHAKKHYILNFTIVHATIFADIFVCDEIAYLLFYSHVYVF
jgi:hypothetical protein